MNSPATYNGKDKNKRFIEAIVTMPANSAVNRMVCEPNSLDKVFLVCTLANYQFWPF